MHFGEGLFMKVVYIGGYVHERVAALGAAPLGGRYRSEEGFVLIRCCTSRLFSLHSYSSSMGSPGA